MTSSSYGDTSSLRQAYYPKTRTLDTSSLRQAYYPKTRTLDTLSLRQAYYPKTRTLDKLRCRYSPGGWAAAASNDAQSAEFNQI